MALQLVISDSGTPLGSDAWKGFTDTIFSTNVDFLIPENVESSIHLRLTVKQHRREEIISCSYCL